MSSLLIDIYCSNTCWCVAGWLVAICVTTGEDLGNAHHHHNEGLAIVGISRPVLRLLSGRNDYLGD